MIAFQARESYNLLKIHSVYLLNFGRGENVDMNRFDLKMIWLIENWNSNVMKNLGFIFMQLHFGQPIKFF